MVETGEADAFLAGLTQEYPKIIRPALQIIGTSTEVSKVAGMHIMLSKKGPIFISDTTINIDPTAEDLVDISLLTANAVKQFNIKPRVALLSYSNFGSVNAEESNKVRKAFQLLKKKDPGFVFDGEIQANLAFNPELLEENYPFSILTVCPANTLIFPNLSAGNITYKLLHELCEIESIGPILLGLKKSVHVLQMGSSVREIVNMATIAVVDAQSKENIDIAKQKV